MRIALVFDMDGVLFDSHPFHRVAWRELLRGASKDVSDAELDFIMEGTTRDEILHHFLGPLTPGQILFYAKQKDAIFRQEEDQVQTVQGLEDFLDLVESASIPMAVASSASKVRVKRMLEKHRLAERFAAILTGDDVHVGKKDPAIFLRAAEDLRMKPSDVLVLEDALHAIAAVKKVGMKCIGVGAETRQPEMIKAGADLVLRDFTDLKLSDLFELFQPSSPALQKLTPLPS